MSKFALILVASLAILSGCASGTESTSETPKADAPKTESSSAATTQTASMVKCDDCGKEVDAKDIVAHGSGKVCKACEAMHNH